MEDLCDIFEANHFEDNFNDSYEVGPETIGIALAAADLMSEEQFYEKASKEESIFKHIPKEEVEYISLRAKKNKNVPAFEQYVMKQCGF
jgi:hypothetical protein